MDDSKDIETGEHDCGVATVVGVLDLQRRCGGCNEKEVGHPSNRTTGSLERELVEQVQALPTALERSPSTGPGGPGAYAVGFDEFRREMTQMAVVHRQRHESQSTTHELQEEGGHNHGLVEALAVESPTIEAEAVSSNDYRRTDQQRHGKIKERRRKNVALAFILAVSCLVVVVVVVWATTQRRQKELLEKAIEERSTVVPLPPNTSNLERLYESLPPTTREKLYDSTTPQYQSWDWLLRHPDLTNLEEWRKQQMFAMGSFYYSMGGPHWPSKVRNRWMNASSDDECSWVMSEEDVAYFAHQGAEIFGPDSYDYKNGFRVCNDEGELQILALHQVWFQGDSEVSGGWRGSMLPSVPPEIEMLTSLKIVGIIYSQIETQLSQILVPELTRFPRLEILSLQGSGLTGSIPNEIGQMTALKQLILPYNKLSGIIPSILGSLTNLQVLSMFKIGDVTGRIPSQLGLLTRISYLDLGFNSLTGSIPPELGSLTQLITLDLGLNAITGMIPTQLGLLSGAVLVMLDDNRLTGALPSELGLLTRLRGLRVGNDDVAHSPGSQNNFSGPVPKEVWNLKHMESLKLHRLPFLQGGIPSSLFMPNLTKLFLNDSPFLSGTLTNEICGIQELRFDCSNQLCGCGCPCSDLLSNQTVP